jgi:hypothetical protein
MLVEDVGARERSMAAERYFYRGREPAQVEVGLSAGTESNAEQACEAIDAGHRDDGP